MKDVWYVWPDGTMCEKHELEEHLTYMSDDYMQVEVDEYLEDGTPVFDSPQDMGW